MLRWIGTPTSTFGGGGGTKLFCSQAASVTNARMATVPRRAAVAFRLALSFNLIEVSERVGFIPLPQFILFWRRLFGETLSASQQ
jgi:AraC-like DNA-binding protein